MGKKMTISYPISDTAAFVGGSGGASSQESTNPPLAGERGQKRRSSASSGCARFFRFLRFYRVKRKIERARPHPLHIDIHINIFFYREPPNRGGRVSPIEISLNMYPVEARKRMRSLFAVFPGEIVIL
jgi:hypothetical protein